MTAGEPDKPKRRPRVILFDTETTGTDEGAQIIESAIAFVKSDTAPLVPELVNPSFTLVQRFRPSVPIEFGAMATHHIIPNDLAGCEPSSEFALPHDLDYLIGHNIDFDWKAAGQPEIRRICTLALARSLWPGLDSHTLSALIYSMHEPAAARALLEDAHSATADVENLLRVLRALCEALKPTSWKELWMMSEEARVPRYITFGKHKPKKGEPPKRIADLPPDYRQWMLRQDDMDEYVKIAVRRSFQGDKANG